MPSQATVRSRILQRVACYRRKDFAHIVVLAALYLVLAVIAMNFGTVKGNATIIWPSAGLGLFALLRFGTHLWPGIFLGAMSAGLWINDPVAVSFAIASGNTLDAVVGVWLLRLTVFNQKLHNLPDYYRLVMHGGLIATAISSLIGPLALYAAGFFAQDRLTDVALHWWMGNALGVALLTPTLLVCGRSPIFSPRDGSAWEALVLAGLSVSVGLMVFVGWHPDWLSPKVADMPFWVIPCLIWAALRFGRLGVSFLLILFFAQNLFGLLGGQGLFAQDMQESGLINFWCFHMISCIAGMTLGIALHERDHAADEVLAEKLRLRSVIDAIPFPIFLKDPHGVYVVVNKAASTTFGRKESDIVGKTVLDVLPAPQADGVLRQDQKVLSLGIAQFSEEWIHFPDARVELQEIYKTPLRDASGNIIGLVGHTHNITARRAAESERKLLYDTIAASHDEVYIFDASTLRFKFINATALENLDYSLEQSHTLTPLDIAPFFTPDDFRQILAPLFMLEKKVQIFETMHKRRDGSLYPVEIHLQLFESESDRYFLAIVQDISHRLESENALRLAASVFEHSKQAILITDAEARMLSVNQAFTRITGFSEQEAIGQNPRMLSSGTHDKAFYKAMWETVVNTGSWSGEIWNRRKDGDLYVEWLDICTVRNQAGRVINYIGLSHDITDRKAAEENIRHLAQHDLLTGLPNRTLFYDRFEQTLAAARRNQSRFALFFLDLNRFKDVNDTLGHRAGDELLKAVAARLTETMRATDTVCRLGGDEFVILTPEIETIGQAEVLSEKLIEKFSLPCAIQGSSILVSFSIGQALYPEHGESMDTLLEAADRAMYRDKQQAPVETPEAD